MPKYSLLRRIAASASVALASLLVALPVSANRGPSSADHKRSESRAPSDLVVLVPLTSGMFQDVFDEILRGIEEKSRVPVRRINLSGHFDPAEVTALLRRSNARVVIALGRTALQAALQLDRDIHVIAGAVLGAPTAAGRSISGISLSTDPQVLFEHMKALRPALKRVFVAYSPEQNDWIIKLGRETARTLGLELIAQPVDDLQGAAQAYTAMFEHLDPRTDAIWLPQDRFAGEENTVLPLLLRESWSRNIPLFSSAFSHVMRGVLMGPFPQHQSLGHRLAAHAIAIENGEGQRTAVVPVRDVKFYVNGKAARRLGIQDSQLRNFTVWEK